MNKEIKDISNQNPDMGMGGIENMFAKFTDIMKKINNPDLSDDEAEETFESALKEIQGMNDKFKQNIENSMESIMNNNDVPEDLKKMLSGVKNNLDQTIEKMNSNQEDLDPEDLKQTSEKLMSTLQNLMQQGLPEGSMASNNTGSNSEIRDILLDIKNDLKEVKGDMKKLENQIDIHEKIIKHLSKK